MTDLTTLSAKALTELYNRLSGKSIKPTSYPKPKLIEMLSVYDTRDEADLPADSICPPFVPAVPQATEGDTFLLKDACIAAGVSPKAARARIRAVGNDHVRTFYEFPRSYWAELIKIISPKKGR